MPSLVGLAVRPISRLNDRMDAIRPDDHIRIADGIPLAKLSSRSCFSLIDSNTAMSESNRPVHDSK